LIAIQAPYNHENKEFLESSSHGAGRAMSRKQAKQNITMDDFKNTMGEIIGVITPATLDESPQAYKNVFAVMNAQKDSVDILYHIKPLINWKG
ncbi:MAG: RtcB family protein, partial [Nanoarchaeota archaeon]